VGRHRLVRTCGVPGLSDHARLNRLVMRTWVSAILGASLILSPTARAKCKPGRGDLVTFPVSGAELPANGSVLLVLGSEQQRVLERAIRKGVHFVSRGRRIPARFTRIGSDLRGLVSVRMAPALPLALGATYTVKLGKYTRSWRATQPDKVAPRWSSPPRVIKFLHEEFGCGPDTHFFVDSPIQDETAVSFDITLKTEDGAEQRSYLKHSSGQQLEIGRGMCGGAFDVRPHVRYRITLVPMDAAGNSGDPQTLDVFGRLPRFEEPPDVD
jgi:hypothetical protein